MLCKYFILLRLVLSHSYLTLAEHFLLNVLSCPLECKKTKQKLSYNFLDFAFLFATTPVR